MKHRLLAIFLVTSLFATVSWGANKRFTLVIDAGHGGHDAGAVGALTKEKTINLNVALAFGRYVERNCPDVKVIYTRQTDVFVELHTRADIANRNKADLFVSIHTNSLPRGRVARGLETYTLGMHRAADNLDVAKRENAVILIEKDYKQRYEGFDPNSAESYIMFEFMQDHNMAQSVELAKYVQQHTCRTANRTDKGVKQAGFLVLRETSMPSCLIELGFISTPDEEQFLHSSQGVDLLGKGIYQAFLEYKRKYDKGLSVPYRAEQTQSLNIPSVVPTNEQATAKASQKSAASPAKSASSAPVAAPTPEVTAKAPADSSQTAAATVSATAAIAPTPAAMTIPTPVADSTRQTPVTSTASAASPSAPVFKVQILTGSAPMKPTDSRLKGEKDAQYYQENGLYKYTVGCSEDYSQVYQLRKQLVAKFPEAFIVAFRDGQKVNVQEAIRDYRASKQQKR